jgi:hypothetical protein
MDWEIKLGQVLGRKVPAQLLRLLLLVQVATPVKQLLSHMVPVSLMMQVHARVRTRAMLHWLLLIVIL